MLKTYSIIPSTFILFLFGLTLISVSPVSAQTVDQLIESIEKLDANDRARVLEYKYSPPKRPSEEKPAAVADDPWDPSMGMRHPARPCMKVNSCGPDKRSAAQIASDPYDRNNPVSLAARAYGSDSPPPDPNGPWNPSMGMRHPARPCMDRKKVPGGCGPDLRSPEQIASDPYDRNNPVSLAARGESGAASPPNRPSDDTPATVADGPWDPSMGMRHPARPCMKWKTCGPDKRSAEQIASDPFDIINGVRQAEEEATRELAKKMSELAIRSPYLRKLNLQPPYRNYCNSVENRKRECAHRKGKWRGRAFAQNAACVNKYGVKIKTACQSP